MRVFQFTASAQKFRGVWHWSNVRIYFFLQTIRNDNAIDNSAPLQKWSKMQNFDMRWFLFCHIYFLMSEWIQKFNNLKKPPLNPFSVWHWFLVYLSNINWKVSPFEIPLLSPLFWYKASWLLDWMWVGKLLFVIFPFLEKIQDFVTSTNWTYSACVLYHIHLLFLPFSFITQSETGGSFN